MSGASTQQTRVLVVDDDQALVRALRLTLSIQGFAVTMAADGLEALDFISTAKFEVIVLDLQMPRMDGHAFFRELRARGHQTPVLILSANGAGDAQLALNAEGALSKLFEPDVLANAVEAIASATWSSSSLPL